MLWVLTGLPLDNLEKYSLKINPLSTLLKRFGNQFLLDSSCPDLLHAISQVLRGSPGSSRSKIPSSERALPRWSRVWIWTTRCSNSTRAVPSFRSARVLQADGHLLDFGGNWDARNEVARKPNRDLKDCVRPTFASREVESWPKDKRNSVDRTDWRLGWSVVRKLSRFPTAWVTAATLPNNRPTEQRRRSVLLLP